MREYVNKALDLAKEIERLQKELIEKQQELRYLLHSCDGALNAKQLIKLTEEKYPIGNSGSYTVTIE
jgi:hypothetical protein